MGDMVKSLLLQLKTLIDPLLIAGAKAAAKAISGIVKSTETAKDDAFFRQFAIDLLAAMEDKPEA